MTDTPPLVCLIQTNNRMALAECAILVRAAGSWRVSLRILPAQTFLNQTFLTRPFNQEARRGNIRTGARGLAWRLVLE